MLIAKSFTQEEAEMIFTLFLEDITNKFVVTYTIISVDPLADIISGAMYYSGFVDYQSRYNKVKKQLTDAILTDASDENIICFGRQLDSIVNMVYTPAVQFYDISTLSFTIPEDTDNWWTCEVLYTRRNRYSTTNQNK